MTVTWGQLGFSLFQGDGSRHSFLLEGGEYQIFVSRLARCFFSHFRVHDNGEIVKQKQGGRLDC